MRSIKLPIGAVLFVILALIFISSILVNYLKPITTDDEITIDTQAKTTESHTGKVTEVTGTAWKTHNGLSSQLRNDESITEGTVIRTLTDSRLQLTFSDTSKISMDGDSVISIEQIDDKGAKINILEGLIIADVENSSRKLEIKANEVTIRSDNVIYSVEIQDEVIISVLKGQADVIAGISHTIVKEHQDWKESRPFALNIDGKRLVNSSSFYKWSVDADQLSTPTAPVASIKENKNDDLEIVLAEVPIGGFDVGSAGVSLSGARSGQNSVNLNWNASGDTSEGFLVNYGKGGSNYSVYLSGPESRSFSVGELEIGSTYSFNVCVVRSGSCTVTSNTISVGI